MERSSAVLRASERLMRVFYRAASGKWPSRGVGLLADVALPRPVLDGAIRSYRAAFGISLDETEVPAGGFRTFDDFFTRRLKPGARPVDPSPDAVTSPADGLIQALGRVERGTVLQAKGRMYELRDLLGDAALCDSFEGGPFVTVYLSPRDYHRVHFPFDASVSGCRYSPGRLYTVAPRAARLVPRLFPQNERITTVVRTPFGRAAVVMVGAAGVGRISVAYGDLRTNVGRCAECRELDPAPTFGKGDELGVFHLGSTVVLVLEPGPWEFPVARGDRVRVGEAILLRG